MQSAWLLELDLIGHAALIPDDSFPQQLPHPPPLVFVQNSNFRVPADHRRQKRGPRTGRADYEKMR